MIKVLNVMNVRPADGEVGIEVEVEGEDLPGMGHSMVWRSERDGSLRGESMEYVLRKPVHRDAVPDVLLGLYHRLKGAGSKIHDSGRAGVHVHINCQDLTMKQVVTFACLYLVFEEMLVEWCGPGREGNLFCLRGGDADYLITAFRDAVVSGRWGNLRDDNLRYASLNLKALSTYGSLEFRAMRSTVDPAVLENWVDMLLRVKDASLQFDDPELIIERASFGGYEELFLSIFGEDTELRFSEDSMLDGIVRAQHIAYAPVDWAKHDIKAQINELIREREEAFDVELDDFDERIDRDAEDELREEKINQLRAQLLDPVHFE